MEQKEENRKALLSIGELTQKIFSFFEKPDFIYFFFLDTRAKLNVGNSLCVFKPSPHFTLPAGVCPNVPSELSLNRRGVWGGV